MKLSVAMITYNHERYIAQAIESVLAQRFSFDYEIVIGEDCSTDGTREIVEDFCQRFPGRIVLLKRERNLGMMGNFIETLAVCRGQYVAFLEGDDYWDSPDKLQRQVDFLDRHPDVALCCHRVQFLDEAGRAGKVFPSLDAGAYGIETLLRDNFVMTCSTVLRRDLVDALPSWLREMKLGDWPLFALVAQHGGIELMDAVMAVYRVHAASAWSSRPEIWRQREVARMMRALDRHLNFRYAPAIRESIATTYNRRAVAARQEGKRTATAKYLLGCLWNGGWRHHGSRTTLAALAAYALMGSRSKVFSRAK